jgi:hypothetical protein
MISKQEQKLRCKLYRKICKDNIGLVFRKEHLLLSIADDHYFLLLAFKDPKAKEHGIRFIWSSFQESHLIYRWFIDLKCLNEIICQPHGKRYEYYSLHVDKWRQDELIVSIAD